MFCQQQTRLVYQIRDTKRKVRFLNSNIVIMLKNVVTVKPFVPEPPESETPEKPEDKYKSSWIYKYFVWIEGVLVIGGILPTHRPKQRWRRYLMYIYISFMCMLHLFNLGRSVSLAFITTLGLTSNMMLVSSYLMTLALVMSTSRRSKYIRPFLQDFTKLYQNGTIPICNYKKSFIMMSKFCAASTVIGLTLIFILFTINLYLSYYINPFFQLLIAPLTFDDPITVKVAYLFVLLVALSMPSFTAPCWLFVSVTFGVVQRIQTRKPTDHEKRERQNHQRKNRRVSSSS